MTAALRIIAPLAVVAVLALTAGACNPEAVGATGTVTAGRTSGGTTPAAARAGCGSPPGAPQVSRTGSRCRSRPIPDNIWRDITTNSPVACAKILKPGEFAPTGADARFNRGLIMRIRTAAAAAMVALASVASTITIATPASAAVSCDSYSHFQLTNGGWAEVPTRGSETKDTNCVLGVGNQGVAVVALQNTLNYCYLAPAKKTRLALDGIYGSNTRAAVVYAQQQSGAAADGVFGPTTSSKMKWYGYSQGCAKR
jgi:peptidoglycan hydrolase-like protein with peptidoglycan-binding domain